jgi:S1-C subfamily serine protease
MSTKTFKPILILVGLLLMVSLACNLPFGKTSNSGSATEATQPAKATEVVKSGKGEVSSLTDVKKAVVQIEAEGTFLDPEFGLQVNSAGRGSGFIVDPSGYIVTNNHVVTGAALVKVWLNGETEARSARVIGYSECNDLAVIKIDGDNLPYLGWYDGSVDPGTEVYLAGFPLGEPEYSLTKGIVSKSSTNGDTSWTSIAGGVLGHDATGNPGNSGGPLVTTDGQVVGIHFASYKDANQYFAIKAATAEDVVPQLEDGKNVDSIGVNGSIVSTEDGSLTGVWVASVASGSPADKAGIKPGDIITQLEGLLLGTDGTMADYCSVIRTHDPDATLSVTVLRWSTGEYLEGQINGRELEVTGQYQGSTSSSSSDTSGGNDTSGGSSSGGSEAQAYFTDEFDGGLDNYSYFMMSGDSDDPDLGIYTEDSALVFDLKNTYLWPYLTYDPYTYKDVDVSFEAENYGTNSNNVSIICRYDPELGWYEFNVANYGLYWIYYYDAIVQKDYKLLFNGGSNSINMGKATNTYEVTCVGDVLTLYINGVKTRSVVDKNLKEGQVGISVASFKDPSVLVKINWLTIANPD